jgi:hypothetical protein
VGHRLQNEVGTAAIPTQRQRAGWPTYTTSSASIAESPANVIAMLEGLYSSSHLGREVTIEGFDGV